MTSRIDSTRRIRVEEIPQSVENLVTQFTGGDIRVPECQRAFCWEGKRGLIRKQKLVDSVMHGYPIPSIILNRLGNTHVYDVYDGRHRIQTFSEYKADKFAWNGAKYSELSDDDRAKFDERRIPVTVVKNATPIQLADIFIRLNSGVSLKDYDLLWANRASPLVSATVSLVMENGRLGHALGDTDLASRRTELANWTALVCGLSTENAGNMTTSYIRLSEFIYNPVNEAAVQQGVDAICTLLERANEMYTASDKEKQKLKRIGRFLAYFIAEYMESPSEDTIQKWTSVIGRLRGNFRERMAMLQALTTKGAQNLTEQKIQSVRAQVTTLLQTGETLQAIEDYDDDSE